MIAELIARVRSLWRGVFRTRHVDADLREEFRLHMDLRAADLVRAGLSPADYFAPCPENTTRNVLSATSRSSEKCLM